MTDFLLYSIGIRYLKLSNKAKNAIEWDTGGGEGPSFTFGIRSN